MPPHFHLEENPGAMAADDLLRKRQRELGGETVYLVFDGSSQWASSSHGTAESISLSIAVFAEAVKTFHANNHVYLVAYSPQTGRRPRFRLTLACIATKRVVIAFVF